LIDTKNESFGLALLTFSFKYQKLGNGGFFIKKDLEVINF